MDIRAQFISSDHALAQEVIFQGAAPMLDARSISKIRLDASSGQIANYRRVGDDLVIELTNGEQIILGGWFEEDGEERGELQILHEDASCHVAVSFADEYPGLLQPQVSTGACISPKRTPDQPIGCRRIGRPMPAILGRDCREWFDPAAAPWAGGLGGTEATSESNRLRQRLDRGFRIWQEMGQIKARMWCLIT